MQQLSTIQELRTFEKIEDKIYTRNLVNVKDIYQESFIIGVAIRMGIPIKLMRNRNATYDEEPVQTFTIVEVENKHLQPKIIHEYEK